MYSLFLDTHDRDVVVVLYKDGKIVSEENKVSSNRHSEILVPLIKEELDKNSLSFSDISLVMVCNGPGSFTGSRLAVTVGKVMAYCLDIPIKTLDALTICAVNVDCEDKCIALEDRNGAYVGKFNMKNEKKEEFVYLSKTEYEVFSKENKIFNEINIDYEKVYTFFEKLPEENKFSVKPIYVKGISALNGKRS